MDPAAAIFRRLQDEHRNRVAIVQMDIMERTTAAMLASAPDPTAPYTPGDRRRALRKIDRAFDDHYGFYRGDSRATFSRIIREGARAALVAAYDLAIAQLEQGLRRK